MSNTSPAMNSPPADPPASSPNATILEQHLYFPNSPSRLLQSPVYDPSIGSEFDTAELIDRLNLLDHEQTEGAEGDDQDDDEFDNRRRRLSSVAFGSSAGSPGEPIEPERGALRVMNPDSDEDGEKTSKAQAEDNDSDSEYEIDTAPVAILAPVPARIPCAQTRHANDRSRSLLIRDISQLVDNLLLNDTYLSLRHADYYDPQHLDIDTIEVAELRESAKEDFDGCLAAMVRQAEELIGLAKRLADVPGCREEGIGYAARGLFWRAVAMGIQGWVIQAEGCLEEIEGRRLSGREHAIWYAGSSESGWHSYFASRRIDYLD